jgi:hypothetical protein
MLDWTLPATSQKAGPARQMAPPDRGPKSRPGKVSLVGIRDPRSARHGGSGRGPTGERRQQCLTWLPVMGLSAASRF